MSNIFPNKQAKQDLLTLLKILGGRTAEVTFSGGGDSGSIEGANLLNKDGEPIDLTGATLNWYEKTSNFDTTSNKWAYATRPVPNMPLDEILIKITEDALENEGLDWYNDAGGQGRLTIDLTADPPKINLNVGINETITHDHSFDYTDSEESEEGK